MNLDQLPDLATVPEVAQFFRISDKKLYQIIANGDLDVIRLGQAIRIPKHEIVRFIGAPRPAKTGGPGLRLVGET